MEAPLFSGLAALALLLTGSAWGRQVSGQGITWWALLSSLLISAALLAFLVYQAMQGGSLLWLVIGVLGNLIGACWAIFARGGDE